MLFLSLKTPKQTKTMTTTPKDKFESIDNELLGYVLDEAVAHFPDFDVDDQGNPHFHYSTSVIELFMSRYNNNEIEYHFKYIDYKNDSDIQNTLTALGIDTELFWYYLLFIYDYTYNKCANGVLVKESPIEQIQNLIDAIYENIEGGEYRNQKNKNEVKLTFSVKGKRNIVIDNPRALNHLANVCNENMRSKSYSKSLIGRPILMEKRKTDPMSVFMYDFAHIMTNFFNETVKKTPRRKKGTNVSLSRTLLVSRLIYFTKINCNKSLLESEDIVKQCLKEYKGHQSNSLNSVYWEKWIKM